MASPDSCRDSQLLSRVVPGVPRTAMDRVSLIELVAAASHTSRGRATTQEETAAASIPSSRESLLSILNAALQVNALEMMDFEQNYDDNARTHATTSSTYFLSQ